MTINGTPTAPPHFNQQPRPPATFKPSGTTFDPAAWADAPPFLLQVPDRNERIAIRNANHKVYRSLGTNSMWHKYLRLGYYVFDDCMDFQRTWKSTAKEAISNRYKTIWKSLHIHRMNDLPISETLLHSAMNTARPYLQEKEPDFILATEIEYEEKNFFATSNGETADKNDNSGWTEVSSKKNRKKTPPQSPELTAQTSPPNDSMDPGFTIGNMEISDEAMLGLALARDTPLPSQETEPTPVSTTNISKPDTSEQPTTTMTEPAIAPRIINPYSRASKERIEKIKQAILKSKSNTIQEIVDMTDEEENIQASSPPDTMDDSATQSTTATTETYRQHRTNKSVYSTTDKTQVNDGTLRMTIRWKPSNYDELRQDEKLWSDAASKMIRDIFYHPTNTIYIVPWQEKTITAKRMVPAHTITSANMTQVSSPQISHIDSHSMSIIGLRICVSDTKFATGSWIKNDKVKSSFANHNVEVQISNSTCDSGKMITAGAILLKHPEYTHRMYFLLALRRKLPNNVPFFDIGVHKRTQNGIECPHLVVRCGENHQETLTEILSDYLDGKQTTALYIGTKILASMTQEATEDLFDIHQKYVNSIQRLSLSPQIVNIDRIREEPITISGGKREQSTREWANGLQSEEGKSFQCDVENGGKDRKAYLLVPAQRLSKVQPMLQKYLTSLRNNTQIQSNNGSYNDRPAEIYVPTASVQRNVDFLRSMSSADIWKNAPSTIRHDKTQQAITPPPVQKGNTPHETLVTPVDRTQMNTPLRHGHSPSNDNTNSIESPPTQNNHRRQSTTNRMIDDNTIATYTSTASTTLNSSYHANRFAELEAAIKANQLDFKSMNNQYQTMETKILETMSSCHENTKQLVIMQGQMNNLQITMQSIADKMQIITQHLTADNNTTTHDTTLNSPVKKKQRQAMVADDDANNQKPIRTSDITDSDFSIETHDTNADQEEAQYTTTSSPGTAMEE
jgi:phosphopantetheinyl transferase (holo-ACP synthase)